ncbi:MAG: sugar phosphate isomerase/epimerase [Clostridiales bacterium]|nr:sugar phosphate isomerase/epimerase [Clostridiales bacterium]
MHQPIKVGTCIPGHNFLSWVPHLKDKGFECFTVNYHMTLGDIVLEELAPQVNDLLDGTGIEISSLGFYNNPLQNEDAQRQLHACIDLAEKFHTNTVSTFAGAIEGEAVDAAIPRFKEIFGELARHAEDKGVRLAIENCPMSGTWNKATCNIGFNPKAWDMMFDAVDSPALGLEWEPAHQMYQLIDPIANLQKYVSKVVHVHGKDASVNWNLIKEEGITGQKPFVFSRFPGLGDTDWRKIFEILQQAGYEGCLSIEGYHDPLFKGDWEMTGQMHALQYLKWCRGGDFIPNPWNP